MANKYPTIRSFRKDDLKVIDCIDPRYKLIQDTNDVLRVFQKKQQINTDGSRVNIWKAVSPEMLAIIEHGDRFECTTSTGRIWWVNK